MNRLARRVSWLGNRGDFGGAGLNDDGFGLADGFTQSGQSGVDAGAFGLTFSRLSVISGTSLAGGILISGRFER